MSRDELTEDQAAALKRIRRAVTAEQKARRERDTAIREASALGLTRRVVADASGLTRGRVQQILDQ
jgi:hypothetical protein